MIAATVMSLIFTPVFYVVMQRVSEIGKKTPKENGVQPGPRDSADSV
jgi:hypothetical protein